MKKLFAFISFVVQLKNIVNLTKWLITKKVIRNSTALAYSLKRVIYILTKPWDRGLSKFVQILHYLETTDLE